MSWFETTNFASIAKTALKEAQKTIDKALDIKDEDTTEKTDTGVSPSEPSTKERDEKSKHNQSFSGNCSENPSPDKEPNTSLEECQLKIDDVTSLELQPQSSEPPDEHSSTNNNINKQTISSVESDEEPCQKPEPDTPPVTQAQNTGETLPATPEHLPVHDEPHETDWIRNQSDSVSLDGTDTYSDIEKISSSATPSESCDESIEALPPDSFGSFFKKPEDCGQDQHKSSTSENSESSSVSLGINVDVLKRRLKHQTQIIKSGQVEVRKLRKENSNLTTILPYETPEKDVENHTGCSGCKKTQLELRQAETLITTLRARLSGLSEHVPLEASESELAIKDELIAQLRMEGEKLSVQQLNYSNIIKKLRATDTQNAAIIKRHSAQLQEQLTEVNRLQKQLSEKSELERQQIDAIRQLTLTNQRQETQLKSAQAENRQLEDNVTAFKESLQANFTERTELQRLVDSHKEAAEQCALQCELVAKKQIDTVVSQKAKAHQHDKNVLVAQIHELQTAVKTLEEQHNRKERQLRADIKQMEKQLAEADARNDDLSNDLRMATRPLVRQVEILQASHKAHQTTWEALEDSLTQRLKAATEAATTNLSQQLETQQDHDSLLEEKKEFLSKISTLEKSIQDLESRCYLLSSSRETQLNKKAQHEEQLAQVKRSCALNLATLRKEKDDLELQLKTTTKNLAEEQQSNARLHQQAHQKDLLIANLETGTDRTPPGSPTVSGSVHSSQFGDDVFDLPVAKGSLYDSLRDNSAVTVEIMTSTLRQREGEVHQLQAELVRSEAQKESLATALTVSARKEEELTQKTERYQHLEQSFKEMNKKYDALLQMYGEKVEALEELQLDLIDVKDLYKAQIDQLLHP